jgi:hypothetical protein
MLVFWVTIVGLYTRKASARVSRGRDKESVAESGFPAAAAAALLPLQDTTPTRQVSPCWSWRAVGPPPSRAASLIALYLNLHVPGSDTWLGYPEVFCIRHTAPSREVACQSPWVMSIML